MAAQIEVQEAPAAAEAATQPAALVGEEAADMLVSSRRVSSRSSTQVVGEEEGTMAAQIEVQEAAATTGKLAVTTTGVRCALTHRHNHSLYTNATD